MKRFLPLTLFAILWLDLIRLLSGNWEAREQYAYGWFVPFFGVALLLRRWQDRPIPEVSSQQSAVSGPQSTVNGPRSMVRSPQSTVHSPWSIVHAPWSVVGVLVFLLALSLLPLRVIFEINADWPLIAWIYTPIVVILTLYAFHLADPASAAPTSGFRFHPSALFSPWVKHFAFPIAFILVALVWPYRIEKGLTQNLQQVVAALTVELLGWFNVETLRHGNLIEVATGTVGVDEACSGIRSFQSTLMAGLLMGELYRLRFWARSGLLIGGLILAFIFNVIRTLLLTWEASKEGISAIDKWHDPAGFSIAIITFFCLWGLAVLLKRWSSPAPSTPTSDLRPLSSVLCPPSSVLRPPWSTVHGQWSVVPKYLLAVGIWSLLCIGATEAWYRSHAISPSATSGWSLQLPESKSTFEKVTLPLRTADILMNDEGKLGKWVEDDGSTWTAYWFRWKPGSMQSVISARGHRPEYCLPAAGLKQVAGPERLLFEAGTLRLPFQSYEFASSGQRIYVFFCLWEDGQDQQKGMRTIRQGDRLQWVREGRRHLGQQTLEFILTGYPDLQTAERALRQRLPGLITAETAKVGVQAAAH